MLWKKIEVKQADIDKLNKLNGSYYYAHLGPYATAVELAAQIGVCIGDKFDPKWLSNRDEKRDKITQLLKKLNPDYGDEDDIPNAKNLLPYLKRIAENNGEIPENIKDNLPEVNIVEDVNSKDSKKKFNKGVLGKLAEVQNNKKNIANISENIVNGGGKNIVAANENKKSNESNKQPINKVKNSNYNSNKEMKKNKRNKSI